MSGDPTSYSYYYVSAASNVYGKIDDVALSVEMTGGVPEPSTWP
jgi:hypothetical protein